MLTPLLNLLDLLVHQPSRARELAALRRELRRQPRNRTISAEERLLARELRALRVTISAVLPRSSACDSCAEHYPPPHGHWPGGYCCGAPTEELFTADELATLHVAGTRARDLRAPFGAHAGCAFRGPEGCALPPVHRPNICVRHICWELARTLQTQGVLARTEDLSQQIKVRFERFVKIRHDRLENEFFNSFHRSDGHVFLRDLFAYLRNLFATSKD